MAGSERIYQNFLLDSTRWDHLGERADDIIIATPYKCGTTWTQNIVLHLIFQDLQLRVIGDYSPWVDMRIQPIQELLEQLEGQEHRRCLKSHLPRDGLVLREKSKYIIVGRDPRDVFMSFWNHYSNYTDDFIVEVNETPGRVGPPLMPCPKDIRELWEMWIKRGWFEWETEGYPHWSNLRHVQTWWNDRERSNILFVHYNDLLADLGGEIRRISDYLGIDCTEEKLSAIANLVTFRSMKRDAGKLDPNAGDAFRGGANTFFNKGTNGRWQGVLTSDDLAMYDNAVARELTTDCHQWLENGRLNSLN
jgi:aryl sulfotransferase